ncbi:hypothetical protein Aple_067940 [Acrocarpospora pleiomorpha]|uniref:VOC domain-containing protein n=1 Tax=Acrocarpospora pleiomorpha TaxID=90975 RepID=A0A5M3XRG6_9ACTN|nr:VOC family protein [Acrocarpospora pleiomorpha]GES23895.1 hypothetical protein Aple_067940 [Acrocarpospora pleiomorpha]
MNMERPHRPYRLIDHIGFIVPDLEAAIARWEAVTGYTFSPIARYRTSRYVDNSDPEPHAHDARIAFSREGPPRIELMEATGSGTHTLSESGVHHFGFLGVEDSEEERERLSALGIRADGESLDEEGRPLLWFTDKRDLDGIRLEFVSPREQPTVRDDGGELWRTTDGRKTLWPPT